MTLKVEYTETGDLQFDLVENGKVIPKEEYSTRHKAALTAISSIMIPDLVEAVLDANGDHFDVASLIFLIMTDKIIHDMDRKTRSAAEKAATKQPGAVKIAIDKNALMEALKKEKEEQDRENNDRE